MAMCPTSLQHIGPCPGAATRPQLRPMPSPWAEALAGEADLIPVHPKWLDETGKPMRKAEPSAAKVKWAAQLLTGGSLTSRIRILCHFATQWPLLLLRAREHNHNAAKKAKAIARAIARKAARQAKKDQNQALKATGVQTARAKGAAKRTMGSKLGQKA